MCIRDRHDVRHVLADAGLLRHLHIGGNGSHAGAGTPIASASVFSLFSTNLLCNNLRSCLLYTSSMKLKTNAKINNDMRTLFFLTTLLFIIPNMFGQKEYRLNSPDGKLEVTLYIGDRITYELTEEDETFSFKKPKAYLLVRL